MRIHSYMKDFFQNDLEIVSAIKSGGLRRNNAISYIYKNQKTFSHVRHFISSWKGNSHDAEDIWIESILVLDRKIRNNEYEGGNIYGFLFGISKGLWRNKLKKNKKMDLIEEPALMDSIDEDDPEQLYQNNERIAVLNKMLEDLGEECQKILKFWQLNYKMKEIAKLVNLSSDNMAKKKKHQCLQKLKEKAKFFKSQL